MPNRTLTDQLTSLMAGWYSGIVDLDLRFDARDGAYKLLDFNPRLGAQFRLFEDTAGIDVVRAAYLDLTGQPVPEGEPVPGRRFLVETYHRLLGQLLAQRRTRPGVLDRITPRGP